MVKILQLFLATVFLIIIEIYCSKLIGNILSKYYKSEIVKTFKQEWVKHKKPFENAIMTNIKENYGVKSMNIYMKHARDTFRFARGFYLSDNVVNVIFSDMILRDWPNLIMPEVSLSLPGNLVKVEATVGKMFVDTAYRMTRNESAVLYSEEELDKAKHSPFSLQQVQSTGKLTIIAEDCFLSGFSIVTFLGNSVTLGHSTFRLADCKFTVEISSYFGIPPVIAPYFPKGPGKQIESLLSGPLRDEMVLNLQGAMYSYINTSVIFDKGLPKYKINQQKLFKQTSSYLTGLCDKLNKLTLEAQKGSIALRDFKDQMETKILVKPLNARPTFTLSLQTSVKTGEKRPTACISLKELKLYGLDTAYASRTGGSFEASQLSIADSIRFHSLQVRGKAVYGNGTQHTHKFAVELADLAVNIIINIEKQGSNSVHKCEVVFGRTFGFSVLPWETSIYERLWYQALVSGYIINEVPARIKEHLSGLLKLAANDDGHDLKLNEENSQSGEIKKRVKILNDDDSSADETNEETGEESVEEPSRQSEDENDTQPSDNTSGEQLQNLSNKTQEGDVGAIVTSDNSSGDELVYGTDTVTAPNSVLQLSNDDKKVFSGLDSDFFSDDKGKKAFISDFENKQTDKQTLADGKSDAVLDSDFFSDKKGQKPLFSDIEAERTDKQTLADGKSDAVLDSDFFSDNKGQKPLFSDTEAEQTDKQTLADGKSDAVLDSDFFSDNKGQKPLFSDTEAEQTDKEKLAGDKMDDVLDKNFFSDDDEGKKPFFSDNNGDKKFISDGDGEKYSVKSENDGEEHSVKSVENVNNNAEMTDNKEDKQILIFASSENDGNKLNTEMTNNENDKNQLKDDIAEQSEQQSVPIERNGKNSHGIADNETVNRKRPTKRILKSNKKELNNLKMTLRKNPRANTIKVQIRKITTRSVKHYTHNKTRLLENAVHMSDNEIR